MRQNVDVFKRLFSVLIHYHFAFQCLILVGRNHANSEARATNMVVRLNARAKSTTMVGHVQVIRVAIVEYKARDFLCVR